MPLPDGLGPGAPKRDPKAPTTLTLLDRLRQDIVKNGQLNRLMLRAAFGPAITDRAFGIAFSKARAQLQSEGLFIKPVPGKTGLYTIATPEDVTHKALDTSRTAVVKQIRKRGELLVDAQKHAGLDEESRSRINAEEIVYSRFVQIAERSLLKAQRKKPEGLG